MPGIAAEQPLTQLGPNLIQSLEQAAEDELPAAFEAAVREALSHAPQQQAKILRLAIALRPDWAARRIADVLMKEEPALAAPKPVAAVVPATTLKDRTAVNTKPIPKAPVKPAVSGSVDFGGILRTGNTENAGLKAQLKLGYQSDRWQHKGLAEGGYLQSETDTLEQRFELEYEANYDIRKEIFAFGLANYTDDRFSGFDYELLSAAGLGVRLFDEGPVKWEITAGPSLRYAKISDSDEMETSPGARFTNDITWQISDGAFLGNETEVLWDRERVTIDNDTSIKMRIVEQLSGKLSLNTRYRSNVPEDTETTDTTTRASIVYDF
ncbi:YdiY family protein [Pelagibius sp. Alg239-R121]|uniref:DUF481 domain-containing protein n=1 Tax=Pelagibius sp. Alg239-R121 TaxID=2993448 RepID=UPI0024A63751|nr:DUF481 domain-containing protein [Pelagibius sp. Alg239-R121]